MAVINFARREIEAKIVFYGPALSGKTTNVKMAHAATPAAQRGQLSTLATEDERTLYFDYAPITMGQIAGFTARFKLFSVPGQAFYSETRKAVLKGADAVVFVADSAPDRARANLESLQDLERNLKANGLVLSRMPFVLQYNKRDVAGARSVDQLNLDLNRYGVPAVEAVAVTGQGVAETLAAVTQIASDRIRDNLTGHASTIEVKAVERLEEEDHARVVLDTLRAIQEVRPEEERRARASLDRGEIDARDVDAFLFGNVEREGVSDPGGLADAPTVPPPEPEARGSTPSIVPDLPPLDGLELPFLTRFTLNWAVESLADHALREDGGLDLRVVLKDRGGPRRGLMTVALLPKVHQEPRPIVAPPEPPKPPPKPPAPKVIRKTEPLTLLIAGLAGTLLGVVLGFVAASL